MDSFLDEIIQEQKMLDGVISEAHNIPDWDEGDGTEKWHGIKYPEGMKDRRKNMLRTGGVPMDDELVENDSLENVRADEYRGRKNIIKDEDDGSPIKVRDIVWVPYPGKPNRVKGKVLKILDHIAMVVPWNSGHEDIFYVKDLKRVTT